MTPNTFLRWMQQHKLTYPAAAEKLDISRQTVQRYLAGTSPIPLTVAYSCAAINQGIQPLK